MEHGEIKPQLDLNSMLSVQRTFASCNRTVMSQLRTSTSLITFGFAVYKFFQLDLARGTAPTDSLFTAREFGIMMIMIGLASLVLGVFEYRRDVVGLRKQFPSLPRSTAGAVAALVALLGLMALIAAFFRQ